MVDNQSNGASLEGSHEMKTTRTSTKAMRAALAYAYDNATTAARRVAGQYITFNPQDKDRRYRDLDIELCGIENLYHKMLNEIERIERIENNAI